MSNECLFDSSFAVCFELLLACIRQKALSSLSMFSSWAVVSWPGCHKASPLGSMNRLLRSNLSPFFNGGNKRCNHPPSRRSILCIMQHVTNASSIEDCLLSWLNAFKNLKRRLRIPKTSSMSLRTDSSILLNFIRGLPGSPALTGNIRHGQQWCPLSQMRYTPLNSFLTPPLADDVVTSHAFEFSQQFPARRHIMTTSSVRTICLLLQAPGWLQVTDWMNFLDEQITLYAIEGNPSFPLYMLVYWCGHWSHPMCTQSIEPTQPGNPIAVYSPTTNWYSCSVRGMYIHRWCIEFMLKTQTSKNLRWTSSLMFAFIQAKGGKILRTLERTHSVPNVSVNVSG